ncbi:hypothetical protein HYU92_04845 [Candidatus Curtissbacteria bacterium]|nr:hypothetical protein [Candidatus Curtissbacteria bacterium]
MFRDYYEVRDWLESFIPLVYGKEELGLARIEYLLKLLGNPERKFKSVHIAGTSGKGSTAFYTAKLLQWVSESVSQKIGESVNQNHRNTEIPNHRIGLHVSPHLVDIRERMQIFRSGKWKVESGKFEDSLMSMDRFIRLMNEVKAVVEKIQRTKPE